MDGACVIRSVGTQQQSKNVSTAKAVQGQIALLMRGKKADYVHTLTYCVGSRS